MSAPNLLYAQSGGVTAVINATAAAVIRRARGKRGRIGSVYAAANGILGVLDEALFDTGRIDAAALKRLAHSPGGAFGSCRYKLKSIDAQRAEYARLVDVLRAHDIGYFLYNGGNDSADTAAKLSTVATAFGWPLTVVGIPKTVDNDLVGTDTCPGFGSVAKYTAIATLEASLDVRAMHSTSTKVFILETMGRHAGWIAASSALAARRRGDPPHLILLPEVPFDAPRFLAAVKATVDTVGWCVVVASEGIRSATGGFVAEGDTRDAFGHAQLGGVGAWLGDLIGCELGFKHHHAMSDYLQRSARHIASAVDLAQAEAVGAAAVDYAARGLNAVMPVIRRLSNRPYRWRVEPAALADIANRERKLPADFIRDDGFGITAKARRFLAPLIEGEAYPPYADDGLPDYALPPLVRVRKKLPPFEGDRR